MFTPLLNQWALHETTPSTNRFRYPYPQLSRKITTGEPGLRRAREFQPVLACSLVTRPALGLLEATTGAVTYNRPK